MDELTADQRARVRELMRTTSLDEERAAFAVRLADGLTEGDITVEGRPPTAEERRRMGLGPFPFDRPSRGDGAGNGLDAAPASGTPPRQGQRPS